MMSETISKKHDSNPMAKPRIDKVTVNVAIGKSGDPLDKAVGILEKLTEQKPILRKAKKTVKEFGIRQGEPIACIVTLKKQKAIDFLKNALVAIGNKLSQTKFDNNGNFAFGISEHIELPGVKYDPNLGIIGMDICVTISKPGYRVKNRSKFTSKIGANHKVTREQSISYLKNMFAIEILEKEIIER